MSTNYEQPPPAFGHPMKEVFLMDPEYINLNNGSYGTTPKPVFEAAHKFAMEAEWNPEHFMRFQYQPVLEDIRKKLADILGAKAEECVLVNNTSTGLNIVLRNFDWEEGDILIPTTTSYGAISRAVVSVGDAPPHPTVAVFKLDFPTTRTQILEDFRKHLQDLPKSPNKKRVAVIDAIVSNPGCAIPWREMVKICKEEGVWSVIDAAHALGQEQDINLTEIGPDFWVSNVHKWFMAKRAVSVMYVPERNQHVVRTSIPTSWTYISPKDRKGPNFVEQYEWNGTLDWSSFLSVDEAFKFRAWLGGEKKIYDYCHNLAIEGGARLAEAMGTRVMDPDGEFTFTMVNAELPFDLEFTPEIDLAFKKKLIIDRKIYGAHFFHNGRWWTRASAQVWNEASVGDFEKLGKAWLEVIAEVKAEFKDAKKLANGA